MGKTVEIDRLSQRSLGIKKGEEVKERGQHARNYFSSGKIVCLYAQLLVDIPGVFCISGCIVGELKETFPVHRRYFALID